MESRITVKETAEKAEQKDKNRVEKKLTAEDIAESIRKGFEEVNLIKEGKLKPRTLKEFLNEL